MSFESARGLSYGAKAVTAQGVFVQLEAATQAGDEAEIAVATSPTLATGVVGVTREATALSTDDVPFVVGDKISVAAMDGSKVEVLVGTGGLTAGGEVTVGSGGTAVAAVSTNLVFGIAVIDAADGEFGTITLQQRPAVT